MPIDANVNGTRAFDEHRNGGYPTAASKAARNTEVQPIDPIAIAVKRLEALQVDESQLAPASPCYSCGAPTEIALVDYEHDYLRTGDVRVTLVKALPGFRCTACYLEYPSTPFTDAFLETLAAGFASAGDTKLQEKLRLSRLSVAELLQAAPNGEPHQTRR